MATPHLQVQYTTNTPISAAHKPLLQLDGMPLFGETNYVLHVGDIVELRPADTTLHGPVAVDFVTGANAHRQHYGGAELIAKACGLKRHSPRRILDCTGGLGRDAYVLAHRVHASGATIDVCESNPVVMALLRDGIARALEMPASAPIAAAISLYATDALSHLHATPGAIEHDYDVIYLDPMFPERRKSAAIKKEMQALQAVVGHEPQDDQLAALLSAARAEAKQRVVVKRPSHAPYLADQKPTIEYKSKAIRFDVYL